MPIPQETIPQEIIPLLDLTRLVFCQFGIILWKFIRKIRNKS
ncbi:hypothetical protein [Dulcicalothrix desertica]|nr:hypothetical protein [Dulcicalothrix desertica]TWH40554.1 hypothetical protein CAL7102_09896 [Dulcicalothrix desertica PCC 7102]